MKQRIKILFYLLFITQIITAQEFTQSDREMLNEILKNSKEINKKQQNKINADLTLEIKTLKEDIATKDSQIKKMQSTKESLQEKEKEITELNNSLKRLKDESKQDKKRIKEEIGIVIKLKHNRLPNEILLNLRERANGMSINEESVLNKYIHQSDDLLIITKALSSQLTKGTLDKLKRDLNNMNIDNKFTGLQKEKIRLLKDISEYCHANNELVILFDVIASPDADAEYKRKKLSKTIYMDYVERFDFLKGELVKMQKNPSRRSVIAKIKCN